MTKEILITKKQADLLFGAEMTFQRAQENVNIVATAILAGHDVEGRVVQVNTDKCLLTIEVPDISPAAEDESQLQLDRAGA